MKTVTPQELFPAILDAHHALRPQVAITPLTHSLHLSLQTGCDVYLKCEHLQHTGSFKFRGASNKIRLLNDAERLSGVITASTGNHGQGVALASQLAAVSATVYATSQASTSKLNAIRGLGAEVITLDTDPLSVELAAAEQARQDGKTYISPYNDEQVIAGQGTIGCEIFEQLPDVDAVFVSVGGGGLISGIGAALKHLRPQTQIIGCWPENAPIMERCLHAGKIIEVEESKTLSDGTAGNLELDSITFSLCQELIDQHVLVSEDEIRSAMRTVARDERWIIEGAAGVAVAAAIKLAPEFVGKRVAIILCGRNIALETFLGAVQ